MPLPPITMLEVEVSNLSFPSSLRTEPIHLSLRGQWGDDPESGFQLSATFTESESGTVSTYDFALRRIDLSRLASVYATTLPVRIISGLATVSGSLRLDSEFASGATSFLLEDFEFDAVPIRPLFGLPAGTSAQVIEGINRYAEDVPIVFGAAIEGSPDAPVLVWEAQLLEIAREGLMMLGARELDRTIEELGSRIDGLGGLEEVLLDPSFETLQQQTKAAARSLIEEAAGRLFQDLPVIDDLTEAAAEGIPREEDESGLQDLLPSLLDNLLNLPSVNEATDGEEASSGD